MNNEALQTVDSHSDDSKSLRARITALEMELEQKNVLLEQGFAAFTDAAEKLRESHKNLQGQVADLNLELEEKNQELERNLEEREKVKTYLSNIFESLHVGVFVTDLHGVITSVNQAGLKMVGQAADALVGQGINEVMGEELLDPYAEVEEGDEPTGTWAISYERGDGDVLRLNLSLTPMTGDGRALGYILNVQDVTRCANWKNRPSAGTALPPWAKWPPTSPTKSATPLAPSSSLPRWSKRGWMRRMNGW